MRAAQPLTESTRFRPRLLLHHRQPRRQHLHLKERASSRCSSNRRSSATRRHRPRHPRRRPLRPRRAISRACSSPRRPLERRLPPHPRLRGLRRARASSRCCSNRPSSRTSLPRRLRCRNSPRRSHRANSPGSFRPPRNLRPPLPPIRRLRLPRPSPPDRSRASLRGCSPPQISATLHPR